MGIPTQLGDYDLGNEAIDKVVAQLEHHGMTALGEHSDVTLAISRQILEKHSNGVLSTPMRILMNDSHYLRPRKIT